MPDPLTDRTSRGWQAIFLRFAVPVLGGALIAGTSAAILWLIDKYIR